MSDPMAEIKASFFIECEELLEALQDGLTAMESGDADRETINICFRAVHSMKGGAGAFGLEELVRFAHRYETVMDEVRAGRLSPDDSAMVLFFRAADVLSDIVRANRDATDVDGAKVEAVLAELEALTGDTPGGEAGEEIGDDEFQPMALALDLPVAETPAARMRIQFAPHAELFRSGNEPRHLLAAVAALGAAKTVCDTTGLPTLGSVDPEAAYLSWEIALETECSEDDVRDIFDFVEGICTLEIETASSSGEAATSTIVPVDASLDLELPSARKSEEEPRAEGSPIDIGAHEEAGQPPRITLSEPVASVDEDASSGPDGGTVLQSGPASTAYTDEGGHPDPSAISPQSSAASVTAGDLTRKGAPSSPEDSRGPGAASRPAGLTQPKPTVRVDLERIDRLVNLVGELVINQAMLSQSVQEAEIPSNSPVAQGLEEFMQLTRDIQDSVMMIRAQPVKPLFQRMSRIVRESSSAVKKRVRLVTDGEGTEVDKTVIERLADPLTHMVRNAVDHGLEATEDRLAAGKPEEGRVTLTAAHRSGRVVIEVSDDGGGIDRAKVRKIAEDKGLIAEGLALSEAEIDALLFLPGFSTASEVSDLSGRGVGMDVVRSSIQELGGRIAISSDPGVGTTFSISLPLTLAVLDGMVVKAAGETLVVPLGAIMETLSLQDTEVRTIGAGSRVLHIRESFVPLLDLGTELGYRATDAESSGSVVLLITQEDGAQAALIVDSIEEQRQVVIKGLQDSYGHVPGIAAATILGDGQIALILDPVDLMSNIAGKARSASISSFELAG